MKKVLIVDDSPLVLKVIRHVAKQSLELMPVYASNFSEAQRLYVEHKESLFVALVDLNLPDAPNGEIVDFMLEQGLPTIVLTGSFSEQRRQLLLDKGVVDYVTKEGRYSYSYAIKLINRLYKNQYLKVLVVDDSSTQRRYISALLRQYQYQVIEAKDGAEGVKLFLANPDVKLLITDYNMPKMNGVELVKNLRYKYEKSDLVIIGLSGEGEGSLSAQFIKNGANDFLQKPFCQEEFHCRIMHNVESLELLEKITDAANRDHLTGAYNRRYFFDVGGDLYKQALANNNPLAAAVIDIDSFKRINDSYGHDVGDMVLKRVSALLNEALSRFLVARAGGEEFFILMPGLDNEKACALLGRVRQIISSTPITVPAIDGDLYVTFSGGVSNRFCNSLDEQINLADEYLYRAKEAGRDLVFGDDEPEED